MKKYATTLILLGALSTPVMASNYAGVQYNMATYEESGFPDADPTALTIIIGKNISDNFAVEGRFGFGMSSGDINFTFLGSDFRGELEIDTFLSVFAKGSMPMGENAKLYGLVGITNGKLSVTLTEVATGDSASVSDSETELSYGFGVEFGSGEVTGTLEYVNYMDSNTATVSAINIGAIFKF